MSKISPVPPIKPLTVSRDDAAAALSVDVQTVDRKIADRTLRASKIGRRVLIRVADIEKMLDANAVGYSSAAPEGRAS
jgi:excisionase family DNA binding protein